MSAPANETNLGNIRRVLVKVNELGKRIGDSHGRAVFTDHEVELMRQLREGGMKLKEIAEKFETTKGHVSRICNYTRRGCTAFGFKHVSVIKRQKAGQ